MNGIEQIRESRQHGYWGAPIDNYECLDAERHVDYLLSEIDRLQAKLAHVERLEREAAAGKNLAKRLRAHELRHGLEMEVMLLLMDYEAEIKGQE